MATVHKNNKEAILYLRKMLESDIMIDLFIERLESLDDINEIRNALNIFDTNTNHFIEVDEKSLELDRLISDQFVKYNHDLVDLNDIKEKILSIDYDKIIVELTNKGSIAFKFIFYIDNEKVVVIVDKIFESNDCCVSVIRNGVPIFLDIQSFDDVIESTKQIRGAFLD